MTRIELGKGEFCLVSGKGGKSAGATGTPPARASSRRVGFLASFNGFGLGGWISSIFGVDLNCFPLDWML